MGQQSAGQVESVLQVLEQWLRDEVAPVIRSGANWKATINGAPGDVRVVIEKHGQLAVVAGRPPGCAPTH